MRSENRDRKYKSQKKWRKKKTQTIEEKILHILFEGLLRVIWGLMRVISGVIEGQLKVICESFGGH